MCMCVLSFVILLSDLTFSYLQCDWCRWCSRTYLPFQSTCCYAGLFLMFSLKAKWLYTQLVPLFIFLSVIWHPIQFSVHFELVMRVRCFWSFHTMAFLLMFIVYSYSKHVNVMILEINWVICTFDPLDKGMLIFLSHL